LDNGNNNTNNDNERSNNRNSNSKQQTFGGCRSETELYKRSRPTNASAHRRSIKRTTTLHNVHFGIREDVDVWANTGRVTSIDDKREAY